MATKKKVPFIDLLRPNNGIPLNVMLETWRWMVETASDEKYITHGIGYDSIALLDRNPTCVNIGIPRGFTVDWQNELFQVFRYVLLSEHCRVGAKHWLKDYGISIHESRMIPMLYEPGEILLPTQLYKLFAVNGRRLKRSHNSSHPAARTVIKALLLSEVPKGQFHWRYAIVFGYADDSSSGWAISLQSEAREPIKTFVERATEWMESQLEAQTVEQNE